MGARGFPSIKQQRLHRRRKLLPGGSCEKEPVAQGDRASKSEHHP
jgi:hypothetical protein